MKIAEQALCANQVFIFVVIFILLVIRQPDEYVDYSIILDDKPLNGIFECAKLKGNSADT